MPLTLAEFVVRYLKDLGVRHVFGITAHSVFQITDALYREAGIEFVPTQSEMAAAYMAEGYARAGRQLGVCLVSAGPGAANMVGGVAHAFKESTPMLALSSEVSTAVAGKSSTWHEIGQQEMFAPITRLSRILRRPDEITYLLPETMAAGLPPPTATTAAAWSSRCVSRFAPGVQYRPAHPTRRRPLSFSRRAPNDRRISTGLDRPLGNRAATAIVATMR